MNKLPASLDFTDREITLAEEKKLQVHDAMQHHVNEQKERIKEQAELLHQQLKEIERREDLAKQILRAKYSFEPVLLKPYSLYQNGEENILSLIKPDEWNGNCPFGSFIAFVRQLGDATWEEINDEI